MLDIRRTHTHTHKLDVSSYNIVIYIHTYHTYLIVIDFNLVLKQESTAINTRTLMNCFEQ